MSDNLNKKVLLIGTTQMALDYLKVLKALNCATTVVGRGDENANVFEKESGLPDPTSI